MKGMYIAAIVLVLLLIITGTFFYMKNNKSEVPSSSVAKLATLFTPKNTNPWVLRPKGNWFGKKANETVLDAVPSNGAQWTESKALAFVNKRSEIKQYALFEGKLYFSSIKNIWLGPARAMPQIFYVRN
jgi:hypothetical protein